MKILLVSVGLLVILAAPRLLLAEEQVRDQRGAVLEYRLQHPNGVTYAYDRSRNPIYIAVPVPDGKGAIDYRNHYGVHVGMGVPNTARDFRGPWHSK